VRQQMSALRAKSEMARTEEDSSQLRDYRAGPLQFQQGWRPRSTMPVAVIASDEGWAGLLQVLKRLLPDRQHHAEDSAARFVRCCP
jgi:hypothetical protein